MKLLQEFLQILKSKRIQDDEIMISFDVTLLFTSVPQKLAVLMIKDLLQQEESQNRDSLKIDDVIHLLRLCLRMHFTFQGTMYEQIKDTPMGSPIPGSSLRRSYSNWSLK